MSKRKGKGRKERKAIQPVSLVDRNLVKVNPFQEQFEPTVSSPINQHKKMAGVS